MRNANEAVDFTEDILQNAFSWDKFENVYSFEGKALPYNPAKNSFVFFKSVFRL